MQPALAHPLGNMGISHYSELRIELRRVDVRYAIDFAEIPTFQELHKLGITANAPSDVPLPDVPLSFLRQLGVRLVRGLALTLAGRETALAPQGDCRGRLSPGAAGMRTLRVECDFSAMIPYTWSALELHYRDGNFAQRSGWKEVVLHASDDVQVVSSSAPSEGRSAQLTRYPEELIASPPQATQAHATLRITPRRPQR